jgi:hypothetical protein
MVFFNQFSVSGWDYKGYFLNYIFSYFDFIALLLNILVKTPNTPRIKVALVSTFKTDLPT